MTTTEISVTPTAEAVQPPRPTLGACGCPDGSGDTLDVRTLSRARYVLDALRDGPGWEWHLLRVVDVVADSRPDLFDVFDLHVSLVAPDGLTGTATVRVFNQEDTATVVAMRFGEPC